MKKQEMEKFLKDIMHMHGCEDLCIIDGNKWHGNYGHCASVDYKGNLEINKFETLRSVYKVAHRIFMNNKVKQDDRIYVGYSKSDYYSLILFNNAHQSAYDDSLYILANGQIYDAYNKFWYDIHASKVLKKMLKKGYDYYDPNNFYEDWRDEYEEEWDG